MNVQLRYRLRTHSLSLAADANVGTLQNEAYRTLKMPTKKQKIISRGSPITESNHKLQNLQINNDTKLLLLETADVSANYCTSSQSRSSEVDSRDGLNSE